MLARVWDKQDLSIVCEMQISTVSLAKSLTVFFLYKVESTAMLEYSNSTFWVFTKKN